MLPPQGLRIFSSSRLYRGLSGGGSVENENVLIIFGVPAQNRKNTLPTQLLLAPCVHILTVDKRGRVKTAKTLYLGFCRELLRFSNVTSPRDVSYRGYRRTPSARARITTAGGQAATKIIFADTRQSVRAASGRNPSAGRVQSLDSRAALPSVRPHTHTPPRTPVRRVHMTVVL